MSGPGYTGLGEITVTEDNEQKNPRVFISYSWDSPEHRLWVESFAQELRRAGIDARLDAWRDESQSIDDFMMIELERADFVLAICTPRYKQKIIENAEGEARTASGFEMGTAAALRRAGGKDVIPVLRSGTWLEAAPSSLVSYRFYDFTGDDVGTEFEQLRDRLLGHVRRPPELGPRSGPAAAPDLPDIFEGGAQPAPPTETVPASGDAPRSPPPQAAAAESSPPPAAPSGPGTGRKWLWALGGAVGVIVLLMFVPTDEEPGQTPTQSEDLASEVTQAGGFAEEGGQNTEEGWSAVSGVPATEPAQSEDDAQTDADMQALLDGMAAWQEEQDEPVAEWEFFRQEAGCYVQKALEAGDWIQLGYDSTQSQYVIGIFTAELGEIEQGKIQHLVFELDDNPQTARSAEAVGYHYGDLPGVYVYFQDDEFLWGLAQRHTLSVYWNQDPYRDYWVTDGDLSGSYQAMQNLMACQQAIDSG